MSCMFAGAASFDHPLEAWKVDNVTSMHAMFNGASSYRHPLAEWRIDNVTNMSHMLCINQILAARLRHC